MTTPHGEDRIHGEDEFIIEHMDRVLSRLDDRISQLRSAEDTSGIDPSLATVLQQRMDEGHTHLTRGMSTAEANITAAKQRMDAAHTYGGAISSTDTRLSSGGAAGYVSQAQQAVSSGSAYQGTRPMAVGPTVQATGPGPIVTERPQQMPSPVVPATRLRGGSYIPPRVVAPPQQYAQRLRQHQQLVQQREQARASREERLREQKERMREVQQRRREQLEQQRQQRDERAREREERLREIRSREQRHTAMDDTMESWRNEINQLDFDHQQDIVERADDDTISHEEASKIIEEALADYYAEEPAVDGAQAMDPVGGAYMEGSTGALAPAGSIGMPVEQVNFTKVNLGVMNENMIHAYIEDAMDLNGWTPDPNVRAQVHNLMYHMAMHESGGNPNAANGWDSNAVGPTQADGYPYQSSRGTWQTIPQTFATYHVAGTSESIYDPQASAAASLAYMMNRYGFDPTTGAGVAEFASRRGIDVNTGMSHGNYIGY